MPALIIGLYVKRPRPLSGILSMGIGASVAVLLWMFCRFILLWHTNDIPPAIIIPSLAVAFLAYALGHWMEETNFGA